MYASVCSNTHAWLLDNYCRKYGEEEEMLTIKGGERERVSESEVNKICIKNVSSRSTKILTE